MCLNKLFIWCSIMFLKMRLLSSDLGCILHPPKEKQHTCSACRRITFTGLKQELQCPNRPSGHYSSGHLSTWVSQAPKPTAEGNADFNLVSEGLFDCSLQLFLSWFIYLLTPCPWNLFISFVSVSEKDSAISLL